jgi:nucleotide-binding universal stress UspA family protein
MTKLKKILAPVDLSELSMLGVRYALDLAQWQQSEVIIYNVVTLEETPYPQGREEWVVQQCDTPKFKKILDQRMKLLDRFVQESLVELAPSQPVRREIGIGTPYKRIIEKAAEESMDLIIMSTHGRTGLAHMLIGSVTERVLRRAPCPVLAVPSLKQSRRAARRALRKRDG